MSFDQRPSRIKLVSNGSVAAPSPEEVAEEGTDDASAIEPSLAEGETEAGVKDEGRSPIFTAILFLVGSAIGGVGLAAWPHLIG